MATHQQQAFRLSSDVIDFEIPEQVQQALIQARQQRIESELESKASIGRHYRALVGRGASPAQIAQGLQNVINTQATSGRFPARDHRVLAEAEHAARREADRARETENDSSHGKPPNEIREHDQTSVASAVCKDRHIVRAAFEDFSEYPAHLTDVVHVLKELRKTLAWCSHCQPQCYSSCFPSELAPDSPSEIFLVEARLRNHARRKQRTTKLQSEI